jgi:hypothetical protein
MVGEARDCIYSGATLCAPPACLCGHCAKLHFLILIVVGSELARAGCQSASKLAGLGNPDAPKCPIGTVFWKEIALSK